ncbi:MAG TPA: carboxypeptidase-like regulatory domain-containing protein [Thermoanaerobaculia bacterium]|nr:carboxypeptidase-like regulatory domain-containing protein [Thermoanaerobaculia bacterium]
MRVRLLSAVLFLVPMVMSAQTISPTGINVRVTRAGVAVANATVCVGTSLDRNLFFQAATDAQGRVNFPQVPREPFVVTARAGSGGAQQSFAPASPTSLPLMSVTIAVPASGGPSCPTTPAGPARRLGPTNFVLPTAPPVTSVQLQNNQKCFGALGAQCGQPQGLLPPTALCANGSCLVNGGSWDHDECCFRNPRGMACQAGPLDAVTGHDGNCVASWNKALRLVSKGLNWRRNADFQRTNGTGTVEFNLYCAPANTLLPPADAAKCCSRQSRALNATEQVAATVARETLVACR